MPITHDKPALLVQQPSARSAKSRPQGGDQQDAPSHREQEADDQCSEKKRTPHIWHMWPSPEPPTLFRHDSEFPPATQLPHLRRVGTVSDNVGNELRRITNGFRPTHETLFISSTSRESLEADDASRRPAMSLKDFVVGAVRRVLGSKRASEVAERVATSETAQQVARDAARSPTARRLAKQAAESEFVRDVAKEVVTSELAKDLARNAANRAARSITRRVKDEAGKVAAELFDDAADGEVESATPGADSESDDPRRAAELESARRAAEERARWDRRQAQQRRDWAAAELRRAEAEKEREIDDELAALKKKLGKG